MHATYTVHELPNMYYHPASFHIVWTKKSNHTLTPLYYVTT